MFHSWFSKKRVVTLVGVGLAFAMLAVFSAVTYLDAERPRIKSLSDYQPAQATRIYSDDGYLVAMLAKERRTVVPIEAIPKFVREAFLAAEDSGFYDHQGLDYLGIARALLKNLRPGAHVQGASTITQQLVKTLVVGPERSYTRKLREALLARELEQWLTKEQILYLYLNQIYFGSGVYGVEQAAQIYFGKSVRDLKLAEAAILACAPKNPSKYTLRADPKATKERQRYVLQQMVEHGWANAAEAQAAMDAPLPTPAPPPPFWNKAPHYVEHVKKILLQTYSEQQVMEGGLAIYTGMHAAAQAAAHTSVEQGLEDFARSQGTAAVRLRIEVDAYTRIHNELRRVFSEEIKKREAFGETADEHQWLWDLRALKPEHLVDETKLASSVNIVPLQIGARIVGVVTKVDSVEKSVYVDLGGRAGFLRLEDLAWARRTNSSKEHELRNPNEILHQGDLVRVEVVDIPTQLAKDASKKALKISFIPEPKAEAALVAIDPTTRLVRAVVGGYEREAGGLNRALQSRRQPGSSFKPIVYAVGLDTETITPAGTCSDSPVVMFDSGTGKPWTPENYEDGKYDGTITYRNALMRSKNTCSVKLIEKLGTEKVISLAKSMGIESPMPSGPALALGTGEVKPIELCNAYSTIASGGSFASPIFVRKVIATDGTILEEHSAESTDVLRPAVAFVLTQMMRSVIEEGTATKALVLDRPLAGKTGTTNKSIDAWFSGFSPELVATVWVGFDDGKTSLGKATGGTVALPIWIRFMGRALENVPRREFSPPSDVVFVRVDADSGDPYDGVGSIEEAFLEGTEPSKSKQLLPSIYIEDDQGAGLARNPR